MLILIIHVMDSHWSIHKPTCLDRGILIINIPQEEATKLDLITSLTIIKSLKTFMILKQMLDKDRCRLDKPIKFIKDQGEEEQGEEEEVALLHRLPPPNSTNKYLIIIMIVMQ